MGGKVGMSFKDFFKYSIFKKEINVYGANVKKENAAIKNIYNNIHISALKYQSKTSIYLEKFKIYCLINTDTMGQSLSLYLDQPNLHA